MHPQPACGHLPLRCVWPHTSDHAAAAQTGGCSPAHLDGGGSSSSSPAAYFRWLGQEAKCSTCMIAAWRDKSVQLGVCGCVCVCTPSCTTTTLHSRLAVSHTQLVVLHNSELPRLTSLCLARTHLPGC